MRLSVKGDIIGLVISVVLGTIIWGTLWLCRVPEWICWYGVRIYMAVAVTTALVLIVKDSWRRRRWD